MFGFKNKSIDTPASTSSIDTSGDGRKGKVATGIGALVLTGLAIFGAHEVTATPIAGKATIASEVPAPAPTDIAPVAPDTSTYVIPNSEATSAAAPDSEATTPSTEESLPIASSAETATPTEVTTESTPAVEPTPEELATAPEVTVPVLTVEQYQDNPEELVRAVVETSLQAWANAGTTPETAQVITAKLAQGGNLSDICAKLAIDNAAVFASGVFGPNYATIPSVNAAVEQFTKLNADTLEKYYQTVDGDPSYMSILTAISPKVLDNNTKHRAIQATFSLSIANNGADTSLGTNGETLPVDKINLLVEDADSDGTYTVTGYSK